MLSAPTCFRREQSDANNNLTTHNITQGRAFCKLKNLALNERAIESLIYRDAFSYSILAKPRVCVGLRIGDG
jgi:hypothetical protein